MRTTLEPIQEIESDYDIFPNEASWAEISDFRGIRRALFSGASVREFFIDSFRERCWEVGTFKNVCHLRTNMRSSRNPLPPYSEHVAL